MSLLANNGTYLNARNTPYGVFNGVDSTVSFGGIFSPLAGGSNVHVYEFEYRLKESGVNKAFGIGVVGVRPLGANGYNYANLEVNYDSYTYRIGYVIYLTTGVPVIIANTDFMPINAKWHKAVITITEGALSSSVTVNVDGSSVNTTLAINSGIPSNTYDTYSDIMTMTEDPNVTEFYLGDMREFKYTLNSNLIIDCPDPSTGVNDGSGSNGTPVNVQQRID